VETNQLTINAIETQPHFKREVRKKFAGCFGIAVAVLPSSGYTQPEADKKSFEKQQQCKETKVVLKQLAPPARS